MPAVQLATAAEFDAFQLPSTALKGVPTPSKDKALQWASRVALSYVRKRKTLPLISWGEDLKAAVCELTGYYLVAKRGYAPNSANNTVIRDRYVDAIDWLKDVRSGLVELDDCVDSSTDATADVAGPLMASDTIVSFQYQTRSRNPGGYCGGDGLG